MPKNMQFSNLFVDYCNISCKLSVHMLIKKKPIFDSLYSFLFVELALVADINSMLF